MQLILSNQSFYTNTIARSLVEKMEAKLSDDAIVYYEYPFVLDNDNCVLRPSKKFQVLLIHCVNDKDADIENILNDLEIIDSTLLSRFMRSTSGKIKKDRRNLVFSINTCLVANPEIDFDANGSDICIYKDLDDVGQLFHECGTILNDDTIREIQAIIEGTTSIIKPKERRLNKEDQDKKAYILKMMEEQIAVMDMEQKHAAIAQLKGRVRKDNNFMLKGSIFAPHLS